MSVYRIISAERARFSVSLMCELLGVSRSGFNDWSSRAPSDRTLTDAWLTERIRKIHQDNREVYARPASTPSCACATASESGASASSD